MTRYSERKKERKTLADERKTYADSIPLEEKIKRAQSRPGSSSKEIEKLNAKIVVRDAPKPEKKPKKEKVEENV